MRCYVITGELVQLGSKTLEAEVNAQISLVVQKKGPHSRDVVRAMGPPKDDVG
jgi:hypothetical protein